MSDLNKIILDAFHLSHQVAKDFFSDPAAIESVATFAKALAHALQSGNKALSCGNGGSLCDSMHFAEELTGRFHKNRKALPAIAISDSSHITCTANDYGYDQVFSRYVEAHGNKGDVLLALSTSGNSPSIIEAVKTAKEQGVYTVGLLGKTGGKLKALVDLPICVPAQTSDRIQEIHIQIIHITIQLVENILFPNL